MATMPNDGAWLLRRRWRRWAALALSIALLAALAIRLRARANDPARDPAAPARVGASDVTAATLARLDGEAAPARGRADDADAEWFLDRAGPPIALAGRVFLDGKPAQGVAITSRDDLTTDGLIAPGHAVSDHEGRFVLPPQPRMRGWYRVVAQHPGAAPAWAAVPGDMPRTDLELRLETCRFHVYGVVADASGGAVASARVFFERIPETAALSDARGRFALCAPLRATRLRVEALGYGSWMKSVSGRGAVRQDVTLVPAAGVEGQVVMVRGGAPVSYALVGLRLAGESVKDMRADRDGRFEITGVAPGSYAIEARTRFARSKEPVSVSTFASSRAHVTVPIDTRARVQGRVVTASGPVAHGGVSLGFAATSEWGTAVRTGDDGSFTIDDAPLGNVLVKVDDFEVESPRTLLVPEAGRGDVVLHVAPKGQLLVTVTRRGAPVSDASVHLRGVVAAETRTTDAAGVATFKGLGEPSYRVVTEHDSDFAVLEHVAVARDAAAPTAVTLELAAGRQIEGRVVDDKGAPVDGARITFTASSSAEDSGASAVSGEDGSFRGGPLRGPQTYVAKVMRSGFALDPSGELPRLTVPESGPVSPSPLLLVVKTHDLDVSGRVVDAQGGPVRDARVVVSKPERHAEALATTFSGDDGSFTLRGLGAGPWSIKATAASGSEAEVKPILLPTASVRIEMPSVGTIQGSLKGFAHTPSVMAWSIAGYEWDFHPAVVESGRFTIAGLSRGKYHVAASSTDAAAQTTVDVDGVSDVQVELAASATRTLHGKTLDFVTARPLPDMTCQAAPYIAGARSPVVVPGSVFSNDQGDFDLVDVPASDLYMWCTSDASFRGGVARMPATLDASKPFTVWGLDMRGRPPLDTKALGMSMVDDQPFSRQVATVEPKGAADRAGVRVGDVLDAVGDKPLLEVGNGMVRNYLALVLSSQRRTPVTLTRAGAPLVVVFALDAR